MTNPETSGADGADQVLPYEGLAPIYDFVMRHVDYVHWANHVHGVLQQHGSPRQVAELACGTGNIAFALADLGYEVSGYDVSEAMVRVAAGKADGDPSAPRFAARDLRNLSGLGPFDAAVCLYDSLNYLLALEDVGHALAEVHRVLSAEGVFIFDVCTERNSLQHFRDVRDVEQGPEFHYSRHSWYDASERLQYNEFDIRYADGTRRQETHVQRIYPHDDIVAAVESSPFELLATLDGFSHRPGSEQSDRVHFVLRRSA